MILERAKRRLRRHLGVRPARPCILMYHRVAVVEHDPWALAVSPQHFEQQVRHISKHRLPMSLSEMVRRLHDRDLPAKAIALTFDDAYRDNLVHAEPVLGHYKVPATVFVPTGYVGTPLPFWWDELAQMILECPGPKSVVQRCANEQVELQWGLREEADADRAWRGWDTPQTKRQESYLRLWSRMQRTTKEERERIMQELRETLDAAIDPLAIPMTEAELKELTRTGLVRLGAHTVNHASLSDLTIDDARREVQDSRMQCEAFTTQAVDGFAYPYGNMSPEVRGEVASAGFSWACSTQAAFLDGGEPDHMMLPRITVIDVVGRDFAALLTD